jgi:regulator of protease activity HflC (stomatin/prohibitin superfamily)
VKTTSPQTFGPVTANPSEFLVHYRRGKPLQAARGATAFCLPYLDRCVLVSGTAHQVEFRADQITAENQGIEVAGFAVWRVEDPLKTCASFDFSNAEEAVLQVSNLLKGVVESATRHEVARMNLNDVLRQRTTIIDALKEEVAPLSSEWGIVLDTVEIRTVKIFSRQLFENLQAKFRDSARLDASISALETERAINEQRCREEILRIKAEMETRAATEELELRKARHEQEVAALGDETERRRIGTSNTRDRALTVIDRLPAIAGALPLHHIEIRADMLGDLMRTLSDLASTPRTPNPKLKEHHHE